MRQTYEIDLKGRKELLPVLEIENGVKIAFFNLHGDAELTEYCAQRMAEAINASGAVPEVLLTAESKGLQLTHCVARNLRHRFYAVARKSKKLYMQDGISVTVKSITTKGEQTLYLSAHDAALLQGRRVAIVDDVISTGSSLHALEALVLKSGGRVVLKAAVLAEGDAAEKFDITYLGKIPLL